MTMEKRNLIEEGRTPGMDKQADADEIESDSVAAFKTADQKKLIKKDDAKDIAVLAGIFILLMGTIVMLGTKVSAKPVQSIATQVQNGN